METKIKKRGGDNGKRKPIIDEYNNKWCACTRPKLTSPYHGKGQASCLKCGCTWYN